MASWLVAHSLFVLFVCIVSSSVVPLPEQGTGVADTIAKTKRTPSTDLALPDTHTDTLVTQLNLTAPRVECDSSLYGLRLNVASCQQAWELLPTGSGRRTVGLRDMGTFDIPLPFRVISGECDRTASSAIRYRASVCIRLLRCKADDGLCAIDVKLKRDAISERSSNNELAHAASLILDLCVKGYLHKGGVAEDLGEPDCSKIRWKGMGPSCFG